MIRLIPTLQTITVEVVVGVEAAEVAETATVETAVTEMDVETDAVAEDDVEGTEVVAEIPLTTLTEVDQMTPAPRQTPTQMKDSTR